MHRLTVSILVALIAQANAKDLTALVEELVERGLQAASLHHADFEHTTLAKPGLLAVHSSTSRRHCEEPHSKTSRGLPARRLSAVANEKTQLDDTGMQVQEQTANEENAESAKPDDSRSVFLGNVDYGTTVEELHSIFSKCGTVNRITIKTDKDGNPKGYAYIEFCDSLAVSEAFKLDNTAHRGRQIKVLAKRTNVLGHPGKKRPMGYDPYDPYGMMGGYGMMGRGRGRGRGYNPYGMMGRGMMPMMMMPMPMPMPMMPMGGGRGRGRRRGYR